jgi:hypothetical protein
VRQRERERKREIEREKKGRERRGREGEKEGRIGLRKRSHRTHSQIQRKQSWREHRTSSPHGYKKLLN